MNNNTRELFRRFETEPAKGWMLYDNDDLLYGMIQYLATYNSNDTTIKNHQLYLTKVNLKKNKALIWDICGFKNSKTYNNHLNKLVDNGLLEEFDMAAGEHTYPSYGIVINYDAPYKLINKEWLYYLIGTRSHQAIKVYFFLLDKYEWKKEKNEDSYDFTIKEIMECLGYSSKTRSQAVETLIKNILESFSREGVIKYNEYFEEHILDDGKSVPIPKKKLMFVARSKEEMECGHTIKKEILPMGEACAVMPIG